MSNIAYLDLDAVAPPLELVIKYKGKEYPVETPSVDDFIFNIRMAKEMAKSTGGLDEEMDHLIKLLARAVPTMGEDLMRKLKVHQLEAMLKFAHEANGQKAAEQTMEEKAVNPPTAG